MTSTLMRKKQQRILDKREGGNVTTEAETGVTKPQAKNCLEPPDAERGRK